MLVRELAVHLARDFHLVLVSPDEREAIDEFLLAGRFLGHVRWDPALVGRERARALADELKEMGVELAHFHCGGSYGWGMRQIGTCPIPYLSRRGICCVTTVHSVGHIFDGYCGPQKPFLFKLALLPFAWLGKMHVLAHTSAEIAVSRHNERELRGRYGLLRNKYTLIYHSRLSVVDPISDAARAPIILNVGHLSSRKGQVLLAEAFARVAGRHPEWKLHFAGPDYDGQIAPAINSIAEKAGLSSRLVCLGQRNDAQTLMRTAGVYVQPSTEEALGLALQEALFEGCPSIGTTAGGIPELITDGDNGRLVSKGDVEALAGALDELMTDESLRKRFGERGRSSIIGRGMSSEAMVRNHLALYRRLLGN